MASEVAAIDEADGLQTINRTGSINFDDQDPSDTVSISSAYRNDIQWLNGNGEKAGDLSAEQIDALTNNRLNAETNNEAQPGSIPWDYSANIDLDFLAIDETITFSYLITATDSHNGTSTDVIEIIINGKNDAPIAADNGSSGELDEATAALQATGQISFSEKDQNDRVSFTEVTLTSVLATEQDQTVIQLPQDLINFLASRLQIQENRQSDHQLDLDWTYALTEEEIAFMGEGDQITLTFTAEVSDQNNSRETQEIVINLRGHESIAQVIGGDFELQALEETVADDATISGTGNIYILDMDLDTSDHTNLITGVENISLSSNVPDLTDKIPSELGTAASNYQELRAMLDLRINLEYLCPRRRKSQRRYPMDIHLWQSRQHSI